MLPPKSNCAWENGLAEHGLICPVELAGLTALVLAKHRIIENRAGMAQTTSCPPHFHKAPSTVCLVRSSKPPTIETSLLSQATYPTALSAITIGKFCPNAKPKSLSLQLKAVISFPHHSRQEKK